MPDEQPPRPLPSQSPALIALPTLAKFHVVWRRLFDVVLLPSCLIEHGLSDAPLLIEYRFQLIRVAPSTLQLRSKGRPSLRSSTFPRFLLPSLPPSSSLPRFLHPSLPHFLHLGTLRHPALSYRPSSLHPLSALLNPGGSIESSSKASS